MLILIFHLVRFSREGPSRRWWLTLPQWVREHLQQPNPELHSDRSCSVRVCQRRTQCLRYYVVSCSSSYTLTCYETVKTCCNSLPTLKQMIPCSMSSSAHFVNFWVQHTIQYHMNFPPYNCVWIPFLSSYLFWPPCLNNPPGTRSAWCVEADSGKLCCASQSQVEVGGGESRDDSGEELDRYSGLSFSKGPCNFTFQQSINPKR